METFSVRVSDKEEGCSGEDINGCTANKIGKPVYELTKQFDPETNQRSILFVIEYPKIEQLTKPLYHVTSSSEQKVESFNKRYQYILFSAEPYETIGVKVPNTEIVKIFSHWNSYSKKFAVEVHFKTPETI